MMAAAVYQKRFGRKRMRQKKSYLGGGQENMSQAEILDELTVAKAPDRSNCKRVLFDVQLPARKYFEMDKRS